MKYILCLSGLIIYKMETGYIYVRCHSAYDADNACKLGKTTNIPDRDNQYATSEVRRGHFVAVYKLIDGSSATLAFVEKYLQTEFTQYNVHYNGGHEFYDKSIIPQIAEQLTSIGVDYIQMTQDEIANCIRKHRERKYSIENMYYQSNPQFTPRDYQRTIIGKSFIHFQRHSKGTLVLVCGIGKTLISLWIAQQLNTNSILIGVPNRLLLKQWETVVCALFPNSPFMCVRGGISVDAIAMFLTNHQDNCILITTYSSAHKVHAATIRLPFVFHMKILDEVHHVTTMNATEATSTGNKTFVQMLPIMSNFQLSLTATLKHLECDTHEQRDIISNDDVAQFGEIIDRKTLMWAIQHNIVCDYAIQTIVTEEDQLTEHLARFHIRSDTDKRLFLSAYASLKSISEKHSHHLLIYSNSQEHSQKIIQYVHLLVETEYFVIPLFVYSNYDGSMNTRQQKTIIRQFVDAPSGIISCVYCLGEGWDIPLLDAVVFAENMSSSIRIVQSALRASRKDPLQPNKIAKIILPILNTDDWLENNDLKKVQEVIYQMGVEDETIIQKITAYRLPICLTKLPHIKDMSAAAPDDSDYEFGEYDEELTQQIRLKTVKRSSLAITYEQAKRILAQKHVVSKEAYWQLCSKDVRLPFDPSERFGAQFIGWIDYLGIDRSAYYDLATCKAKIKEYMATNSEIKMQLKLSDTCEQLCKLDKMFPPVGLWTDVYETTTLFSIIGNIAHKKKGIVKV